MPDFIFIMVISRHVLLLSIIFSINNILMLLIVLIQQQRCLDAINNAAHPVAPA
jgi:hypothetical protein